MYGYIGLYVYIYIYIYTDIHIYIYFNNMHLAHHVEVVRARVAAEGGEVAAVLFVV